jgi:hypothetical protein
MRSPGIATVGALGNAAGEATNQWIYNDKVDNYEKIAYNAIAGWATGPIAESMRTLVSLSVLSGTTNASVTAYNNSQQGSNDSVAASFGFGVLGGGLGWGVGTASGYMASRTFTTTIANPNYNPALGVLLTGPSVISVPNQAVGSALNLLGGSTAQAGVAAVAPPVTTSNNTK